MEKANMPGDAAAMVYTPWRAAARAFVASGALTCSAALTTPVISGDGRFIAFSFVDAMPLSMTEVYLHDRGRMLPGDLNGDGVVDLSDEAILLFNWGDCPCCAADLDGDGDVDCDDLYLLGLSQGPCP
jgi:hypothetical protein